MNRQKALRQTLAPDRRFAVEEAASHPESRATRRDPVGVVVSELRRLDPRGERIGRSLRASIDQLCDRRRTGSRRWEQLRRVERAGFSPLIEICMQREFLFEDGVIINFRIAGVEAGCVFSPDAEKWTIPSGMEGQVCLFFWVDEAVTRWSIGATRPTQDHLDRDPEGMTILNNAGQTAIFWLFQNEPLPLKIVI